MKISDLSLEALRKKALSLPSSPGVYIMKNRDGKIIYIGKAKQLKNRVSGYFGSGDRLCTRVRKMREQVRDFDYILTASEFEALVLECSLIKRHRPKYNVLLKDDRGYSYIKITKKPHSAFLAVYRKENDGAEYIGPFMSGGSLSKALDDVRRLFLLPDCGYDFSKSKKSRPCLSYYIGNCAAPCCGYITPEEYERSFAEAAAFLKGGSRKYAAELERRMKEHSEKLEFERAAELRDRLLALRKLNEKQKVISDFCESLDVFSLALQGEELCFNLLRFSEGKLFSSENHFTVLCESLEHTRSEVLERFYASREDIPKTILLDGEAENSELISEWLSRKAGRKVSLRVPKKGRYAELVSMSVSNAAEGLRQHNEKRFESSALKELGELLGLGEPPRRIEAYDISHTAGSDAVGVMAVFENGLPRREAYRKFIIKEAKGGDDPASLRELLSRRLSEYLRAKDASFARLPDLILVDGGEAQLKAVLLALSEADTVLPVFSMVKDGKHRTRAVAADGRELEINKFKKAFTLISRIQEEVHGAAVSYHRRKRKDSSFSSLLLSIPGIGEKKEKALWERFGSLDAMKKASLKELEELSVISKKDAINIKEALKELS